MSDKIIVPFDKLSESQVDTGGVFTTISFESIRKLLGPAVDLDEDEKITGLIITKDGIKIRIDAERITEKP